VPRLRTIAIQSVAVLVVLTACESAACGSTQQSPQASDDPNPAAASKPLPAEDVFKNIKIFKGVDAVRLLPAMIALRGLLGVECTYCHTQYEWANEDKPAKQKARQHFQLLDFVNHRFFADANAVSCWTCHRGHSRPSGYRSDNDQIARATTLIALPQESSKKPGEQVFKNIQVFKGEPAGNLPEIMSYFTASLGVPCTHCHVPGAYDKDDKPQKAKARKMLGMANAIVTEYYGKQGPVGCFTCHQGKAKPEIERGKGTEATFDMSATATTHVP
jgi:Photosynthetic reaction centre cytochrome C subunit